MKKRCMTLVGILLAGALLFGCSNNTSNNSTNVSAKETPSDEKTTEVETTTETETTTEVGMEDIDIVEIYELEDKSGEDEEIVYVQISYNSQKGNMAQIELTAKNQKTFHAEASYPITEGELEKLDGDGSRIYIIPREDTIELYEVSADGERSKEAKSYRKSTNIVDDSTQPDETSAINGEGDAEGDEGAEVPIFFSATYEQINFDPSIDISPTGYTPTIRLDLDKTGTAFSVDCTDWAGANTYFSLPYPIRSGDYWLRSYGPEGAGEPAKINVKAYGSIIEITPYITEIVDGEWVETLGNCPAKFKRIYETN